MARCGGPAGHSRHWFSDYGFPGFVRSHCVRCGAPNPRFPKVCPDCNHEHPKGFTTCVIWVDEERCGCDV